MKKLSMSNWNRTLNRNVDIYLCYSYQLPTYISLEWEIEKEKEIKINPTIFSLTWILQWRVKTLSSKEHTSEYTSILKQKKTPAPGGRLIFKGNRYANFNFLWLVIFLLSLILVISLVFCCFILYFLLKTHYTKVY